MLDEIEAGYDDGYSLKTEPPDHTFHPMYVMGWRQGRMDSLGMNEMTPEQVQMQFNMIYVMLSDD